MSQPTISLSDRLTWYYETCLKHRNEILVYIVLPATGIFVSGYLSMIIVAIQWALTIFVVGVSSFFLFGLFFGLHPHYDLLNYRFAHVIKPFNYGYRLSRWLIADIAKPSENEFLGVE